MITGNPANRSPLINGLLMLYVVLTYLFVFAPILASFVFSFNSDRFPTIPLGQFSTEWYRAVAADPMVLQGLRNTLLVGVAVAGAPRAEGAGDLYSRPASRYDPGEGTGLSVMDVHTYPVAYSKKVCFLTKARRSRPTEMLANVRAQLQMVTKYPRSSVQRIL